MLSHKTPDTIVDYYILVYKPNHPKAENGYVPEQILVAEEFLERPLYEDEIVKHINGDPHDNRPQNLRIGSIGSYSLVLLDLSHYRHLSRTFVPCKFQKPCWKEIRAPIAKKNKVYLPWLCSYQIEGDIYKCSHFWNYTEKEKGEKSE